jgi:hypothetical protein
VVGTVVNLVLTFVTVGAGGKVGTGVGTGDGTGGVTVAISVFGTLFGTTEAGTITNVVDLIVTGLTEGGIKEALMTTGDLANDFGKDDAGGIFTVYVLP